MDEDRAKVWACFHPQAKDRAVDVATVCKHTGFGKRKARYLLDELEDQGLLKWGPSYRSRNSQSVATWVLSTAGRRAATTLRESWKTELR